MTSTLPEDPYHALGLDKDATSAAIKTAYRKLVLKHHPDKVQDDSLKQSAADLFHKVQSAWETIGDDDKRTRYDAQVRLCSLRKEAVDRDRPYHGGSGRSDARPTPFRSASDAPRAYQSPHYRERDADRGAYRTEEIRPHDTVDRRDFEVQHERPRRTPPKEERRSKLTREDSKESERLRQREKVRQSTKATTRDRDYKYSSYSVPDVESGSDSDHHYERRRSPREDERRQDKFFGQERRQSEGLPSARYAEERVSRAAKEYIERSVRRQDSDSTPRRPSPPTPRLSSRDHSEYTKDSSGRPVQLRRSSARGKTSSRDDDDDNLPRRVRRETSERLSGDYDERPRRPPGLSQAKSVPSDIHMPYDKPRANSVQHASEQMKEFIPPPVRRADSMPHQSLRREETTRNKPTRSSTLRHAQLSEEYDVGNTSTAQATPPPPQSRSPKAYADDFEKATPDGYVIETREPTRRRSTSPEPAREKTRSSSTRYPTPSAVPLPPLNTRTTSYAYSPQGVEVLPSRPKLAREGSSRKESYLYGEIPTSASPRAREVKSADHREVRPDYKLSSGHSSRRPSENRSPSDYRTNSFNAAPSVSA